MLLSQAPFSCFAARSRPTLFSKVQSSEGYSYFWVSLLFIYPFYMSFLYVLLSVLFICSVICPVICPTRGLAQLSINHQKQYLPLRFSIFPFSIFNFSIFQSFVWIIYISSCMKCHSCIQRTFIIGIIADSDMYFQFAH